jgi:hypothetical protein
LKPRNLDLMYILCPLHPPPPDILHVTGRITRKAGYTI